MKHGPRNTHEHGLDACIKDGFPCVSETQNKDPDFPFMYFHVAFVHGIYFIFTFKRSQDNGTIMFDKIVEKIDDIL